LIEGVLVTQKLDIVEFAVHQLEQSLLTLTIFGGSSTVDHLVELHARIMDKWDEDEPARRAGCAVCEALIEAINVDNNGNVLDPPSCQQRCVHEWKSAFDRNKAICLKCVEQI
jgi:hypothetical protein